jgi:ATP-dependent DNA helicase RecG
MLTGSCSPAEKAHALDVLATGEPALIVGTHALIQRGVAIPNAGLVVIDEQHRFGVNQRAAFRDKGINADLIVMTATPIPRTLALALYGNFETITINELPPGRHAVETRHTRESDRKQMDLLVRKEIESGRQAFVVCPEIGEDKGAESRATAGTKRVYARYARTFPDCGVGLLHGRMSAEEREQALHRFRENTIQILIATTIIEVGVDVSNATVIIIEDADRFGLAQLHQLRGRVGRAHHKSYCFLMGEPTTAEADERIRIMTSTNDGFAIAEQDLLLRGPGEFLGTAQSGLPRLRVGHLLRDADLIERARLSAIEILRADPRLESQVNQPLLSLLGRKPGSVHL